MHLAHKNHNHNLIMVNKAKGVLNTATVDKEALFDTARKVFLNLILCFQS